MAEAGRARGMIKSVKRHHYEGLLNQLVLFSLEGTTEGDRIKLRVEQGR